jgi:hypothetical protein
MLFNSYREYLNSPVFRAARALAIRDAKGKCLRCGGPVSEVHHPEYPPLEPLYEDRTFPAFCTFDVPSDLEPVCHDCHCLTEGKAK